MLLAHARSKNAWKVAEKVVPLWVVNSLPLDTFGDVQAGNVSLSMACVRSRSPLFFLAAAICNKCK